MAKKRQHCKECDQLTTQERKKASDPWTCLCCESAKRRSAAATEAIKARNKASPRFNTKF